MVKISHENRFENLNVLLNKSKNLLQEKEFL
jgi:hypothetical protein